MDFWTLAGNVGLPLAMVIIALLTGQRRVWTWGTELADCEARAAATAASYETRLTRQAADYEARLEAQRAAHLTRETEMATQAAKWQALLFESIPALKGLTEAVNAQIHRGV